MDPLRALVSGLPTRQAGLPLPEAEIVEALERLDSSSWVEESLALDPYWPKWDSPWWYMVLLYELGLAERIPRTAREAMISALNRHYLHRFPFRQEDVPAGLDPRMQIMCHCGLACMYSVLAASGEAVDEVLPWARPWFLEYQLPDGGLNCDEAAYLRDPPRSSLVSTLPPLEAVLRHVPRPSPEEEAFLALGADYLLKRRLCRSLSQGGKLIDEDWLIPTFPRFYEYDVLRGLQFVTRWALSRGRRLPMESLREAVTSLCERLTREGQLRLGRSFALEAETLYPTAPGQWTPHYPATTFPLLEAVSRAGEGSPYLTRAWLEVAENLFQLERKGLLDW